MSSTIVAGAKAPEAIDLTITSTTVNLTTVTAVSCEVWEGSVQRATWVFAIVGTPTSGSLTARYVFHASGTDAPSPTSLILKPRLTTPAGVRRAKARRVQVVADSP